VVKFFPLLKRKRGGSMNISIIGTGYVGLVTGTCFSELGHNVICIDNDEKKIEILEKGGISIYEPDLEKMIRKNRQEKRLRFSSSIKEGVKFAESIFICVGTPSRPDGDADLSAIERVAIEIAEAMDDYKLIVEKSTVPVQTGIKIKSTIELRKKQNIEYDIASNPEFLREGSAIQDFMHPDRVVIGVETERASKILREIYKDIDAPIVETDIESAEIIKHASNSFLAAKISFINAVALLCEKSGANVEKVAEGMGLDKRIGKEFLKAGIGFGGSCFPKDVDAFIKIAERLGYDFDLLKEVKEVNRKMRFHIIHKLKETLWNLKDKKIAVLGLAFKPNTDDMRNAPSIDIINSLLKEEAKVVAYDPKAMEKAKEVIENIEFTENPYEAFNGADAVLILTEWDDFKDLDIQKIKSLLKTPVIIDGRNIFSPDKMKSAGFIYKSIGR